MMKMEEIRKMADMDRRDFCETYGIPMQTMKDWEEGKIIPPDYLMELLERAVREDKALSRIYYVVTSIKHGSIEHGFTEEYLELKTPNKNLAIKKAWELDHRIKHNGTKNASVEIRLYADNIEDEDCECFDYDTVDFATD